MIQLVKGFKDILPQENLLWQKIEQTAKKIFEDFGFKEIRLPIIEKAELFTRSIGENTDIVEKEIYTFIDGKRGLVTLRPEATASVVRSYIQQKMYAKDPIKKLYTIGPMFRKEQPQKGRYRQFYQIDAEVFGVESPYVDAQIIYMLSVFFMTLKVPDIKILINSLGCPECRPKFQMALLSFLDSVKENLCSDCIRRRTKNPFRVLDCKVQYCKNAVKNAPAIIIFLCDDCKEHFHSLKKLLTSLNVFYEIDTNLVRGLDYYTRTIFEIQTTFLGTQSAVAGGGRYDGLINALGGPSQPATGFAIGFDRLVELLSIKEENIKTGPEIFIIALCEKCKSMAFEWLCVLNKNGVKAEMDFSNRSLKSLMKRADKLFSSNVLIFGESEFEQNEVILRDMINKEQVSVPLKGLVENLIKKFR